MALLEKQLLVKESILPNAGKGLFTEIDIPKRTRIIEYKGKITTWKKASALGDESPYIFYVSANNVIDALTYKKSLARYANDAQGLVRVKGIKNNCRYVIEKGRVYIEAAKNIEAGSEILVSYGKTYWDTIRSNSKL